MRFRRNGLWTDPTTWRGWSTTLVIKLLASVQVVLYLVRDPLKAVIVILVVTATELAVLSPLRIDTRNRPRKRKNRKPSYWRRSERKSKGIWRNGRSAMVFKWLAERFTALWCAISPPLHGGRVRRKWSHLMHGISILRGVRIGRIHLRDMGPADTNALGLFKYVYDDQYCRRPPFVFQPVSDILSRGP